MPLPSAGKNVPSKASAQLSIVYRDIHDLKRDPNNPRRHPKSQIRQIARSIETFGFSVPLLVDRNGRLIAGHARLAACEILGLRRVPTICLEHLTDSQVRGFLIAENRLSENATWDQRLLGKQLKDLTELNLDFDIEAIGFDIGAIRLMVDGAAPAVKRKRRAADPIPALETAGRISRDGDLWLLGRHKIFCGNATDASSYLALMDGRRAAMVVASPCQKVQIDTNDDAMQMQEAESTNFFAQVFALLAPNTSDGSLHYVFAGWQYMREVLAAGSRAYGKLKDVCVWITGTTDTASLYENQHQLIFVFESGKSTQPVLEVDLKSRRTNVWRYPQESPSSRTEKGNLAKLHAAVRPVALVADAITDCAAHGAIVLDPFLCDGETLLAAEQTGRVCCGLESDPMRVDAAIRRWQSLTGCTATHADLGSSFDETEKVRDGQQR